MLVAWDIYFGVGGGRGGAEEINNCIDIAFGTESQEGVGKSFLREGFQVAFFGQEGQDVDVVLDTAFIVEGAEEVFLSGNCHVGGVGCGYEGVGAGRTGGERVVV